MSTPNENFAPIVIFTYKRLDTLRQLISALLKCDLAAESKVYIYSDGAKKESDKAIVKDVRDYIVTISGFKSVEFTFSNVNNGLAKSVITGVTRIIEQWGDVIVLEDDLIPTPNFLRFMNASLKKYQKDVGVCSVSGYSFNLIKPENYPYDAYMLNRGWSWGWATWKDSWADVDWDVKTYAEFRANKKLKKQFNKGGSDLSGMLERQMTGKVDSWAIRWFYHQFKTGGKTVYPVYSKILNIGFDENATHTTGSNKRYVPNILETDKALFSFPPISDIDQRYQLAFQKKMGIWARICSKTMSLFSKYFNSK